MGTRWGRQKSGKVMEGSDEVMARGIDGMGRYEGNESRTEIKEINGGRDGEGM